VPPRECFAISQYHSPKSLSKRAPSSASARE
jgi:hypothetical protein